MALVRRVGTRRPALGAAGSARHVLDAAAQPAPSRRAAGRLGRGNGGQSAGVERTRRLLVRAPQEEPAARGVSSVGPRLFGRRRFVFREQAAARVEELAPQLPLDSDDVGQPRRPPLGTQLRDEAGAQGLPPAAPAPAAELRVRRLRRPQGAAKARRQHERGQLVGQRWLGRLFGRSERRERQQPGAVLDVRSNPVPDDHEPGDEALALPHG